MKKLSLSCLFALSIFAVTAQIPGIDDSNPARNIKPDTARPSPTKIYSAIDLDKFPEFPGGLKGYTNFLSKNLKWNQRSEEHARRVILSFVVERDGRLSHFKIEHSVSKKLAAEAMRVIQRSPKWTPGIKNGCKVRVRFVVPVTFEPNSD